MAEDPRLPKWAPAYLLLQALAVLAWWGALVSSREMRLVFFPGAYEKVALGFLLPDIAVYVVGGLVVALAITRNSSHMKPAIALLAGGSAYATIFTIGLVAIEAAAWPSLVCMAPAMLVTGYLFLLAHTKPQ